MPCSAMDVSAASRMTFVVVCIWSSASSSLVNLLSSAAPTWSG